MSGGVAFTAGTASVDLVNGNYVTADELNAYIVGDPALAKAFQDARDAFFQDRPERFYIDSTKLTLRVRRIDNENVAYINNGPNASSLEPQFANQSAEEDYVLVKGVWYAADITWDAPTIA